MLLHPNMLQAPHTKPEDPTAPHLPTRAVRPSPPWCPHIGKNTTGQIESAGRGRMEELAGATLAACGIGSQVTRLSLNRTQNNPKQQ